MQKGQEGHRITQEGHTSEAGVASLAHPALVGHLIPLGLDFGPVLVLGPVACFKLIDIVIVVLLLSLSLDEV